MNTDIIRIYWKRKKETGVSNSPISPRLTSQVWNTNEVVKPRKVTQLSYNGNENYWEMLGLDAAHEIAGRNETRATMFLFLFVDFFIFRQPYCEHHQNYFLQPLIINYKSMVCWVRILTRGRCTFKSQVYKKQICERPYKFHIHLILLQSNCHCTTNGGKILHTIIKVMNNCKPFLFIITTVFDKSIGTIELH